MMMITITSPITIRRKMANINDNFEDVRDNNNKDKMDNGKNMTK